VELSSDICRTAPTIKYPSRKDPESPRKILAGTALYLRKPIRQPINVESRTSRNKSSWLRAMKNRTPDISRVMPDTRPSSPSRRLNEFIVPTINRKIIIAAGMIGYWIPNKVSV